MRGLYVHIPFCDKICKYCDFAKVKSNVFEHRRYLSALAKEYERYQQEGTDGHITSPIFDTVYFGGGTPSALSANDLAYLLTIFAHAIDQAQEITFEANPESLTAEKINILRDYGVNRVSLGVQTFDEKRLKCLNRQHTNAQVKEVIDLLRAANIHNINVDLIYALPEQTLASLQADIAQLLALQPTHISTYAMMIEPHTVFHIQLKQKKLTEVDEVQQAHMYDVLQKEFAANGYIQYEFSNWARPNFFSRHNTKYWQLSEYIGLGLGAHGFYQQMRYANTRSIVRYVEMLEAGNRKPYVEAHVLSEKERMEEMMFLGLRLSEGVAKQTFVAAFNRTIAEVFGQPLTKHLQQGHLIETKTHYKLAPEAIFISNEVLSDFLLDSI